MTTAIDFNKPVASDNYLEVLSTLRTLFGASTALLDTGDYTLSNVPSGAKRYDATTSTLMEYNGSSWVVLPLCAKYDSYGNQINTTYATIASLDDYVPKSGGTMTGVLTFSNGKTIGDYLPLAGGTISGNLTVSGSITGTASRATADADGNTISSTYLKLSGGTLTGNVDFGSQVQSVFPCHYFHRTTADGTVYIHGFTDGSYTSSSATRFEFRMADGNGSFITFVVSGNKTLNLGGKSIIREDTLASSAATTTSTASSANPAVIVKNYVNGKSWYRVWSDGWTEQGGYASGSSTGHNTISLLKSYSNTNYGILVVHDDGYASIVGGGGKTVSAFTVAGIIQQVTGSTWRGYWYTCGY